MTRTRGAMIGLTLALGAGLGLAAGARADTGADNFDQAVLADNPLAYFPLSSPTQGSLVGGYTTTFNGGATVTAAGGGAPIASDPASVGASFNGTPDSAGFGSGPSVSTNFGTGTALTAGTLLGWFNLAAAPGSPGVSGIEYIAGESQVGNDFDIQVQSLNNGSSLYFYTNGGGNINAPVTTGQWEFFAATFDQSANAVDLYLNGALVASGTNAGGPKSSAFAIGDSPVFNPRNFDGAIDDVAVYGSALSATQIQSLYQSAQTSAVPEASPAAFLGLALLPLGLRARRRRAS